VGQGPRWSCLMKKTGGRKSRDRVKHSFSFLKRLINYII
jgi:hypothetical protein